MNIAKQRPFYGEDRGLHLIIYLIGALSGGLTMLFLINAFEWLRGCL